MKVSGLVSIMAGVIAVACSGDVTMSQVERLVVRLEFSRIPYNTTNGRVLHVIGTLANGERIADGDFLVITVMTDDGATIEAPLSLCLVADGAQQIACNEINVTLHPGRTADDLQPLLDDLDAGFVPTDVVLGGGIFGTVHLFSGDVHDALARARDFPSVRLVGYQGILVLGILGTPVNQPRALVPTTLGFDPCERCLAVRSGNEITATYTNPDGSVITASTFIQ